MTKVNTEAEAALEYLPIPATWFDEDLNFLGANKKFYEIFNLNESQIVGEHFSQIFDSFSFMSFMGQFIKSGESSGEFQHSILIDRKLTHFKFSLQNFSSSGRMIVLCAQDITPLIEKKQEIEALRNKTIQSSRMAILGEMTSGIAHEINNPLTVILSHASHLREAIRKSDSSENNLDALRRLDKIINTSYRIEKTVRGLKSFARDGSQDPFQSTLVSHLINESLELCTENLKNHQINLIIDQIEPELMIDCRPAQISQILLNLIGNSKDAIQDLDERWIRLQVKDIGDCVRFSLIDSGHGIPNDISAKLMDAFFTTKTAGEGTGLGLSISKTIVESHYGQLFIDNDCPNTKFVFDIPKGLSAFAAA